MHQDDIHAEVQTHDLAWGDGDEATMGFAGDILRAPAGCRQPGYDLRFGASLCCEREIERWVRAEVYATQRDGGREDDLTAARMGGSVLH